MPLQQFSIGRGDVDERLRPLLSAEDRRAANLTEQAGKRKPANAQHKHTDGGGGEKKPMKKGNEHDGLRVRVVDRDQRASSFLRASGLLVGDEVQVWAFRGEPSGELLLLIAKTAGEPAPNAVPEQHRTVHGCDHESFRVCLLHTNPPQSTCLGGTEVPGLR